MHKVWPICVRCKRPVERMESSYDQIAAAFTFVAHCHGAQQTTVMPQVMLEDAILLGAGVAFADPDVVKREHTPRETIEYRVRRDDGWTNMPAVKR